MERDEVYVPKTRSDLGIPHKAREEIDWDDYFGDTPVYTMYMLIRQQVLAFPAYLSTSHPSICREPELMISVRNSLQCLRAKDLPQMDQSFRSCVPGFVLNPDLQISLIHSITSQPIRFFSPKVNVTR